jgi:protein TonB
MATFAILVGFLVVVGLLLTYDTTWMSVFQDQRNNLVFATRNKVYGAFELRQDYSRRLGFAMLGAVAFFGVVVGTPYLISKLGPADEAQEKVNIVEVNLDNFSEDKPEEPPPPPEVIPPPQPQIETVQFVAVEASDEPVEAPPPTQEDLGETTASTSTQEGEKIDAPPPPPPVEETTYDLAAVQEQPDFPGGMQKMYKYLQDNTKYPDMEFDAGIQGKVYVEFVVDKDGSVEDVKIRRGVSPGLDKEALRAVKSMPKWSPGKMNGKPVKCRFTIPVDFKLK